MTRDNTRSNTSSSSDRRIGMQTVTVAVVVMVSLGVLSFGMFGSAVGQQQPTIAVEDAELDEEGTATVEVTLSEAPNGLAGHGMTVEVADSSTVTITDVSLPDEYGVADTEISDDGATAEISGADLEDNIQSGASDVVLAEVTVEAQSEGETDLSLSSVQADDDEGGEIDAETSAGTIMVGAGQTGGDDGGDDGADGDDGTDGDGVTDGDDGTDGADGDDGTDGDDGVTDDDETDDDGVTEDDGVDDTEDDDDEDDC